MKKNGPLSPPPPALLAASLTLSLSPLTSGLNCTALPGRDVAVRVMATHSFVGVGDPRPSYPPFARPLSPLTAALAGSRCENKINWKTMCTTGAITIYFTVLIGEPLLLGRVGLVSRHENM